MKIPVEINRVVNFILKIILQFLPSVRYLKYFGEVGSSRSSIFQGEYKLDTRHFRARDRNSCLM